MKLLVPLLLAFVLASCGDSTEAIIEELEEYGRTVAASTDGSVLFVSAIQTTKSPLNAFKIHFKTGNDALMSDPSAVPRNAAYLMNIGRTKLWQKKFCTNKLKAIMSRHQIDLVSGDLANLSGETQSMSIC